MLHQSEERERLVGSRTPYYLVPPDKEALPWDEDLEEDLGEGCGRIYKYELMLWHNICLTL